MSEITKVRISDDRVWMKYYSDDVKALPLPRCTVYDHLKTENADHPQSTAINYYGRKISFAELYEQVEHTAAAFAALGVKAGDIVSFVAVATPECIAAIYALNVLGATANTIDPRMDVGSIRRMITESGSVLTAVMDVVFEKVAPILPEVAQERIMVMSASRSLPFFKKTVMRLKVRPSVPYDDVILDWDTFLDGGKGVTYEKAPYDGNATVAITYTGGTTGFPKGVMLTNDSMNAVAFNFKHAGLACRPGERFLGIIPVFASYGMVCGMHMPLCLGFELIPIPKFDPTQFGKLVRDYRPNHMISTPVFYEMMMTSKELQGVDLSFLITMGSGGDTMNEGLEKKLKKFMEDHNVKYPLAQGYGMSELSAAASFCVNDVYKPSSVGIPSVTNLVSIFHPETGEELGYGEEGEICVTGPSMMKGYFKRPEETAQVMRRHDDGQVWIHSGDIGYIDEDGFLFIKGRVKRMITRFDGHKVFPVNMESVVSEHVDVSNCCVVGVNDCDHSQGQYPMVLVQLKNGADAEAVCDMIYEYCMEYMEERGRPVAVLAVDAIPLTGMGKNDYRTLEMQYANFDYPAWQASHT